MAARKLRQAKIGRWTAGQWDSWPVRQAHKGTGDSGQGEEEGRESATTARGLALLWRVIEMRYIRADFGANASVTSLGKAQ